MLLFNVNEQKREGWMTLCLSKEEALDLVEKVEYLLKHPEYHHDHLNDVENDATLDLVVIQVDKLRSYSEDLRIELEKLSLK